MNLPIKSIIKEEIENNDQEFFRKLIKHDENWHNGETYKFENNIDEENTADRRYLQFKTIIINNDTQTKDYFIYDEIININQPILLLHLFNLKNNKYFQSIIYLKKNEVVQQIRYLNCQQFFKEIENDEELIKLVETADTTLIKTPFLEFIENINQEKNEFVVNQTTKEPLWKYVLWNILDLAIFVIAWSTISPLGNLIIAPLLVGIVSASVLTWLPFVIAGLIIGCLVVGYNKYKSKLRKWIFPNWKSKNDINLENKLQEQKLILEKKQQQELYLYLTSETKQERILNSFLQVWEKNKTKNFGIIEKVLTKKFAENKEYLKKQIFKEEYQQKIKQWNENCKEKFEFSKWLKPRHIKEIKETFNESKKNNSMMCDQYFYHPKKIWAEFQEEKIIENIKELFDNPEKCDILKKNDIRRISPIKQSKINL